MSNMFNTDLNISNMMKSIVSHRVCTDLSQLSPNMSNSILYYVILLYSAFEVTHFW